MTIRGPCWQVGIVKIWIDERMKENQCLPRYSREVDKSGGLFACTHDAQRLPHFQIMTDWRSGFETKGLLTMLPIETALWRWLLFTDRMHWQEFA